MVPLEAPVQLYGADAISRSAGLVTFLMVAVELDVEFPAC
jgi:hypothetical protein